MDVRLWMYNGKKGYLPIATDFLASRNSRAALMHFGRCFYQMGGRYSIGGYHIPS